MALIVHVINGEICLIVEIANSTSTELACKFPFGDLYARYLEPQGLQWRILQRGTRASDERSYYDALLPISIDQLPEIVQVVHACTN
jgi:hypothetical protein